MDRDLNENLDPEMLENLDLLLDMDVLSEEENWDLLEEIDEDEEKTEEE